jgi:hypothetical protein
MHPLHFAYVSHSPTPSSAELEKLFAQLNKFDVRRRDLILTIAYLAYEIPFDHPGDEDERRRRRFDAFKSTLREIVKRRPTAEEAFTFGLLCLVLARAQAMGDLARFRQIINGVRNTSDFVRDELRKESIPAREAMTDLWNGMAQIDSIYREVEEARIAYSTFCEEVVYPMISDQPLYR